MIDSAPGLLDRSPEEGARRIALGHLDQAAAAFPRLADPADSEALHDFRVALRRLRSGLGSYSSWLEESLPKKLRRRLKKLAAATGPGRDTEVQIEWLRGRSRQLGSHQRPGLAWLLSHLEERMRKANEEMAGHIPDAFPRLEAALRKRLSSYQTEVRLDSPEPRETLATAAAGILRGLSDELLGHLSGVKGPGDEEECHEARICAKRLRYLLEPFTGELPEAASVVKHMKGLQEILGELHDAHVLERELAASIESAAAARARQQMETALSGTLIGNLLHPARRRTPEPGILAVARLNRSRRDRLFDDLESDWLNGRSEGFFQEVAALADRLDPAGEPVREPD